ncbi:MAG TPA: Asp-tRNA(Asn)/Glu-tRNA(Gln) amidotransferase subunit GatA [Candidatus Saccharimonadales bacterium]|nr:Asp-tRNA(Asn)/Glu-tRNA(Gln) amidotransferase subunit GatA [Candidatus Saccharimonadales bacterium]
MTIPDITSAIQAKKLTARQAVEQALQRLQDKQVEYNVAVSIGRDYALKRADAVDAQLQAGKKVGRLAGVPFMVKDIFLTFGTETTAASNILRGFKAPYQATVIEKLEAEGAIMIAKANQDAFGHGGSTENSDFGVTRNPHDTARVAGGSSGGSAAAVALGIVPFSVGGDTGGSCRQPASFCGVYGVKPTYGLVSRYGAIAMASSTDTIGLLANTADDVGLIYDILAGQDPFDSTTLPQRPKSFLPADNPVKSLKIGIVKEYMTDAVQPEVREAVKKQAAALKKLGHTVEEVSVPSVSLALAVYYIVVPAEISSNLSRYDGVKFGYSAPEAKTLDELYGLTRDHGFNAENKRRILIGTYVLSSGYIDAYYRKAQTVRTKLINEFNKAFEQYDALIGPVAPNTAFKIGQNADNPLHMYLADVMTVAASLAGLPAISAPAGFDDKKLPIGLQIIGPQKSDARLFSLAKQLEQV